MTTVKSPARARWLNNLLVVAALGLLGFTIWKNRDQLGQVFDRPLDGRRLALAFGVYMSALVLTFIRWFVLVRALGLPFRVRDALRLGFIGNVYNLVIPGAVGGDVIKAAFLYREQARKTQAIGSMLIDRAVGLLGLFVLALALGASIWPTAIPQVRALTLFAAVCVACGLIGLAVVFTPALYGPLRKLAGRRERLRAILDELGEMAAAYRGRIGVVFLALTMAVTSHALFVVAFYTVSLALFPAGLPGLTQHFLIVPLILFSTAVPLPFGALGLSEQVSDQLFQFVHHPGGAVAMMGYRALMYGGGLVSVAVYLANRRQVRTLEVEAETPAPDAADVPSAEPEHPDRVLERAD